MLTIKKYIINSRIIAIFILGFILSLNVGVNLAFSGNNINAPGAHPSKEQILPPANIKINFHKDHNRSSEEIDIDCQGVMEPQIEEVNDRESQPSRDVPPPTNLVATNENMDVVLCRWDAAPSIKEYIFQVWNQNGCLQDWRRTYGPHAYFYPTSSCAEGDRIFFIVIAVDMDDNQSYQVASNSVTLTIGPDLGQDSNQLHVYCTLPYGYDSNGRISYGHGWSEDDMIQIEHFTQRMIPIIEGIYGPPSRDYTIYIIRNLQLSSGGYIIPAINEICMGDNWCFAALTHELVHGFRDNVGITLSGFEEGFASAVAETCMNEYARLYPDDPYVDPAGHAWCSPNDWDYDFQNTQELVTVDFSSGCPGIVWRRYTMTSAAIHKIAIEEPNFYWQFNTEWYRRFNENPDLTISRELVIDVIEDVVSQIEGELARDWIDKQYIFGCQILSGRKVWVDTEHVVMDSSLYSIAQNIYHYDTFPNGSEWSYEGNILYHLNGTMGEGILYDFNNNIVWQGNLLIEPTVNPDPEYPETLVMGHDEINLTTSYEMDPETYIQDLHDLNLYRMEIAFQGVAGWPTTSKTVYRVMGDELIDSHGIWGGIIGANGGTVYINHEDYQGQHFTPEPGMPVINGAFYGERNWAGVLNPANGRKETIPGRVNILYIDSLGKAYIKKVNIDRGSSNGNHNFLLDFGYLGRRIIVPDDYPFIQQAIDAAQDSDEVFVRSGTYTAHALVPGDVNINLRGKAITVRSEFGPLFTTIDCQGIEGDRGFILENGEGRDTVIQGFTIKNAHNNSIQEGKGGAIYCHNASPTITNCIFENNVANNGAGIYHFSLDPNNSEPIINNCCFINNEATEDGGAIYLYSFFHPEINNCTMIGNMAGNYGSSIYGPLGISAHIANCIIWDCSGSQIYAGNSELSYCDVYGGHYGEGNISADPLFISRPTIDKCYLSQIAAGQASNSPCVNAGNMQAADLFCLPDNPNPNMTFSTLATRTDSDLDEGQVDIGFHYGWSRELGDVNCNGNITAADAQMAFYIALGVHTPNVYERIAADVTGDGVISASDAQEIFFRVLGISGRNSDPKAQDKFEEAMKNWQKEKPNAPAAATPKNIKK